MLVRCIYRTLLYLYLSWLIVLMKSFSFLKKFRRSHVSYKMNYKTYILMCDVQFKNLKVWARALESIETQDLAADNLEVLICSTFSGTESTLSTAAKFQLIAVDSKEWT